MIAIGVSIVSQADKTIDVFQFQNRYLNAGFGDIWDSMFIKKTAPVPIFNSLDQFFSTGNSIVQLLPKWVNDSVKLIASLITTIALLRVFKDHLSLGEFGKILDGINILGNSIGGIASTPLKILVTIILIGLILPLTLQNGAGWIIGILLLLTILFLLFRIFFLLFTAYLRIILLIIFSPLIILLNCLPGKNIFSFWLKNLIGDLLLFPLVVIIFLLGRVLVNLNLSSQLWTPPFLYGLSSDSFSIIIGVGLIFMIPEIAKVYKELLGLKGLPISLGLGTFFGGVGAGVSGATGLLGQFSSIGLGLNAMGLARRKGFLGLFGALKDEYKPPPPSGPSDEDIMRMPGIFGRKD
jgi:hypothetical protein